MSSHRSTTALMVMVAFGEQNATMGSRTPNERFDTGSSDYITESFNQNNVLMLSKYCDKIVPEYLEFELAPNYNIENLHKACFEMYISDQFVSTKILDIPLRFLMNIKNYEILICQFHNRNILYYYYLLLKYIQLMEIIV